MAFDPIAYGQSLDAALGQRYGRSVPPLDDGQDDPGGAGQGPSVDAAPPDEGSAGGNAPPDASTIDGDPQSASMGMPSRGVGGAKKSIQALPPFKVQYNKSKLSEVKTPGDLVDAMKPASQGKYMNWWESQYGSIQDKYNQVHKELGARPDPDRDMSRKEQFKLLMDFGVRLMHASSHGDPGPGSTALVGALGDQAQKRQAEVGEYDARVAGANQQQNAELKSIGSYGDALKGQGTIDEGAARMENQKVQMQEAQGRMKKAANAAPDTESTDQGLISYDGDKKSWQHVTIDGKPATNLKVGARGGVKGDAKTAKQRDAEWLMGRGIPDDLATQIAFGQVRDPVKAYEMLYRDRRRQYASDTDAAKEAEDITSNLFGANWRKQGRLPGSDAGPDDAKPPVVAKTPPASALKQGQITKFKNGQRWTLGPDGQPKQVQ